MNDLIDLEAEVRDAYPTCIFYDPERECFMDECGFEIDIHRVLPEWCIFLAKNERYRSKYFYYVTSAGEKFEVYWPDEEDENWYY